MERVGMGVGGTEREKKGKSGGACVEGVERRVRERERRNIVIWGQRMEIYKQGSANLDVSLTLYPRVAGFSSPQIQQPQ